MVSIANGIDPTVKETGPLAEDVTHAVFGVHRDLRGRLSGACKIRTQKDHKDPANHDFWLPPHIGPESQNVRSLCLCDLLNP